MTRRAVFFDRDGVLAELVYRDGLPHSARMVEELKWVKGAAQAVKVLAEAGFFIFVITNQPDIARKKMTREVLDQMNALLINFFGGNEIVRGIYVCPHDEMDQCSCRKPKPGLLIQAAAEWDIDLRQSFVIGDRNADISAGKQAGCQTVLVQYEHNQNVQADFKVESVDDAANLILKDLKIK